MSIKKTNNKKANYNYTISKEYTAGIVLNGLEVKSIKNNNFSFNDSYCVILNNEIFLKKFHITLNKEDNQLRDRKLLLKKQEIDKLNKTLKEKGFTLVPTNLIIDNRGFIKVTIGLAKGKKNYDKRKFLKEKDLTKEMKRSL